MRHSKSLLTLFPVLLLACGGNTSQPTPVVLKPCTVAGVGSPDSAWHQVRADGFTFCVPPSWQPSGRGKGATDPKRWLGSQSWVTWGTGRPPADMRRVDIYGTVVVVGSSTPPPPPPRSPASDGMADCAAPTTTPVNVDGVSLLVQQRQCGVKWTTNAWSTAPPMYIQAEANTTAAAKQLMTMVATIRFSSAP